MRVEPGGLDVVCPSCGGRSLIEPAYRSFPRWGCPFCQASNPNDLGERAAEKFPGAPEAARRRVAPLAAALGAVAVTLAAVFAQSAIPRGDYRTVGGVTAALADRGMACLALQLDETPDAGVREAAACVIGGTGVRILTFASSAKRDRYLTTRRPGRAVAGATWIVVPDDPALARTIAGAIGGRVTGPIVDPAPMSSSRQG